MTAFGANPYDTLSSQRGVSGGLADIIKNAVASAELLTTHHDPDVAALAQAVLDISVEYRRLFRPLPVRMGATNLGGFKVPRKRAP